RFALKFRNHVVLLTGTYGLTDGSELSITLPVIYREFSRRIDVVFSGVPLPSYVHDVSAFGPGEVILRTKYLLWSTPRADAAAALTLRLPSGDVNDFRGTGRLEVTASLYLSGEPWQVTSIFGVIPYANAGITVDTDQLSGSEHHWGLGIDSVL